MQNLSPTLFKNIYTDYKDLVFNLALQYTQQTEDAQDITQEVFVKVFQHIHKHNDNISSLKTWIYRITINQSLDFIKAKRRKKRFGFITSLFQGDHPPIDIPQFDHPGIALEDKEELKALFAFINRLPPNQKTALILSRIEERSQKEIGEIMNLSTKAVESLLQRAKNNLSKMAKGSEGF